MRNDESTSSGAAAQMTPSAAPNPAKPERRHLRFAVSWPAIGQTPSGQTLPLRVTDVSQGGIGVVSDDVLPKGGLVRALVRVPAPKDPGQTSTVTVLARVIHQVFAGGSNRAGLEFVEAAPADVEMLISAAKRS